MGRPLRLRCQQGWVAAFPTLLTSTPAFAQSADTPDMMGSLLLQLALLSVLIVVGLIILFIPAYIAFRRQHPNRWAIAVICLAFGGTIIGWFGALIWSLQAVHKSPTGNNGGESGLNIFVNDLVGVKLEPTAAQFATTTAEDTIERLARLNQLADQGILDAEEYASIRKSVLARFS